MSSDADQTLFRFVDFYLSPVLPQKNIALLKIRLDRKSKRIKDTLLRDVKLIRDAIHLLSSKRKTLITTFHPETNLEKTYLEILRIEPACCLILLSESLFKISDDTLSLALNTSVESIRFRRKQLRAIFDEEGITSDEIVKLTSAVQNLDRNAFQDRTDLLQRFRRLPLLIRFLLESAAVLLCLTGLLWVIPEIRNRYENSIQKRINDYLIESSLVDAPPPPTETNNQVAAPAEDAQEPAEEEATVTKSSSDEVTSRKPPKVNEGETWRFSFTGTATSEIESSVALSMQKLNLEVPKPITVPGGIQFDCTVPVDQVIALKTALEQKTEEIQQKNPSSSIGSVVNFSWYKKRNMGTRKIPSAHVQVIIWISTL